MGPTGCCQVCFPHTESWLVRAGTSLLATHCGVFFSGGSSICVPWDLSKLRPSSVPWTARVFFLFPTISKFHVKFASRWKVPNLLWKEWLCELSVTHFSSHVQLLRLSLVERWSASELICHGASTFAAPPLDWGGRFHTVCFLPQSSGRKKNIYEWKRKKMNSIVTSCYLNVLLQTELKTKLLRKNFHWFTVECGGLFSTCEIISQHQQMPETHSEREKKKKPYVKNSNLVISLKEKKNVYFLPIGVVASSANTCLAY